MSQSPKYKTGDLVSVRVDTPTHHFRTPSYVQGKTGRVAALCGAFPNPETLAHGGTGLPAQQLYRVEFAQSDLWHKYQGPERDKLLIDIYEHWLNPVSS